MCLYCLVRNVVNMKKKILFIVGSMNQTSQMHQIADQLTDYDCWFSQFFTDYTLINSLIKRTSLLDSTILAGQFKVNSDNYLVANNLQIDYQGKKINTTWLFTVQICISQSGCSKLKLFGYRRE